MTESLPSTVEIAAVSDVGLVRARNEDALWVADHMVRDSSESARFSPPDEETGLLLAVADGVGGAAAGDVASSFVVRRMAALYRQIVLGDTPVSAEQLSRAAQQVNGELQIEAHNNVQYRGMATTFTAMVFHRECQCWIHAGDSRLYGVTEGGLRQITRDHTLREISGDPRIPGNIIVNCYGCPSEFYVDTGALDPATAEIYLACSDGLSDYADMGSVEEALIGCASSPERSLAQCAADLVQMAKDGGGADNISFLIVRPLYA
jgi:protein phosphatase